MNQATELGNWQSAARRYLDRLARAEFEEQFRASKCRERTKFWGRYSPTEYHRQLVTLLGINDEVAFKSLKLEQGYASALGF